jgi:PAS domain S-box-containing protein
MDSSLGQLSERIQSLLKEVSDGETISREVAARVLVELETVLEELHIMEEELTQKEQALSEASASIEAERERYLDLFHCAPDPYLVTDSHATIEQANEAAVRFLCIAPENIVGKPLTVFVPETEYERFYNQVRKLNELQGMERAQWQMYMVPSGGTRTLVQVTCSGLKGAKGNTLVRWIFRDMTAMQKAEESDALARVNAQLQGKIEELEKFHDVVVGREMKLMELEDENRRLSAQLKRQGASD